MKTAAIYARVSSDKQKEEHTIASQTAALIAFAQDNGYSVPPEWVFEDEGYSGASLVRPGLERVRDLAAEGQVEAVLIHSPDRLSRKYAYQVLLIEEFLRSGVEAVFLKTPQTETPEDRLLLQFQGMIAEYERAQILERSRRGKRHKAKQGNVSVLSGAPYGYRYVRKSDETAAYYEIADAEAQIVRMVYERYTVQGMSIGEITKLLNALGTPTRLGAGRWERSTVWAMLRNPAYRGAACYGKTELAKRQRITRPLRLRGRVAARESANHERSGSRSLCPPSSAPRLLTLPPSALRATSATRRGGPSSRALSKDWCLAANAVTRCTGPQRVHRLAKSTTTAAWDRTLIAISITPFAIPIPSAWIFLTPLSGTRSSVFRRAIRTPLAG